MASFFKSLVLYQSEYLPDTLPAALTIWVLWKTLDPKMFHSKKSLDIFGYYDNSHHFEWKHFRLYFVDCQYCQWHFLNLSFFFWFTILWGDIFIVKHIFIVK